MQPLCTKLKQTNGCPHGVASNLLCKNDSDDNQNNQTPHLAVTTNSKEDEKAE